jgi:ABC-type branched-subunit amino acid transport system ATPase component
MLELRSLEVRYGAIVAVRAVDLKVERGEIVTLIGANGAGKSTITRTVAGLLPFGGEILYEGRSLRGSRKQPAWPRRMRRRVSEYHAGADQSFCAAYQSAMALISSSENPRAMRLMMVEASAPDLKPCIAARSSVALLPTSRGTLVSTKRFAG